MAEFTPAFFDPVSIPSLTSAICAKFEAQPLCPLAEELTPFAGSGIYAIYYRGFTVDLYAPLSGGRIPVYVGRSRESPDGPDSETEPARPLWECVSRSRRLILDSVDLSVAEFSVRMLLAPDVPCELAVYHFREFYRPIWNNICIGFDEIDSSADGDVPWSELHMGSALDVEALAARVREHVARQVEVFGPRLAAGTTWDLPASETEEAPPAARPAQRSVSRMSDERETDTFTA